MCTGPCAWEFTEPNINLHIPGVYASVHGKLLEKMNFLLGALTVCNCCLWVHGYRVLRGCLRGSCRSTSTAVCSDVTSAAEFLESILFSHIYTGLRLGAFLLCTAGKARGMKTELLRCNIHRSEYPVRPGYCCK